MTIRQKLLLLFSVITISFGLNNAALADNRNQDIVGTWLFKIDTGFPQVPQVQALVTFARGGTMTASQTGIHASSEQFEGICGCNAGIAQGIWKRIGHRNYRFKFNFFVYASEQTASFPINVSVPVAVAGQHIGYGTVKSGRVVVRGNKLKGNNFTTALNLDGDVLTPVLNNVEQTFVAKRLTFRGPGVPLD